MAYKVLVCDDESRIRRLLSDFLTRDGYEVLEASDGIEAIDIFTKNNDIALIILDVMMPRLDGIETAKRLRQVSSVPIIMLTAKGEEDDELTGFDAGADEYISKPFSPKILMARVAAIIRRSSGTIEEAPVQNIVEINGISVNIDAHEVFIDGKEIVLSVKEFELLKFFMNNKGIAFSRDKILDNVWDYDYFGDARTVDTHVKKLRSKMGEKGDYIKTIWGVGYKFETE